jgi:hypothetical protein
VAGDSIRRVTRRAVFFAAALASALVLAGCGGGSTDTAANAEQPPPAATATTPATPSPPTPSSGILPERAPETPFTVLLTASGHRPVAGEDWTFTVKAKSKNGSPVGGTVRALVLLQGKLYDTIGWFAFDGTYTKTIRFPLERKDLPLVLRAQVEANGGVKNADYPFKVQ